MDFGRGVPCREVPSVTAAIYSGSLSPFLSLLPFILAFMKSSWPFLSLSRSSSLLFPSFYITLSVQSIHSETDFQGGCNRGDVGGEDEGEVRLRLGWESECLGGGRENSGKESGVGG